MAFDINRFTERSQQTISQAASLAADRGSAQSERQWAAVGERGGSRVLRHGRCINGNARRSCGVEQRVQVPTRYMRI